jgi:hypothetical protein
MKLELMAGSLILFILIAGCTTTPEPKPDSLSSAVCGNGLVEAGEQCDGTVGTCEAGLVCSACKCVGLTPPSLPE